MNYVTSSASFQRTESQVFLDHCLHYNNQQVLYPQAIRENVSPRLGTNDASYFNTTITIPKKLSQTCRNTFYALDYATDILVYIGSGIFISGLSGFISDDIATWFGLVGALGGVAEIAIRKAREYLKKRVITFSDVCGKVESLCVKIENLEEFGISLDNDKKGKIVAKIQKIAIQLYAFLRKNEDDTIYHMLTALFRCDTYPVCVGKLFAIRPCVNLANMSVERDAMLIDTDNDNFSRQNGDAERSTDV
ncbi:MAG: hypothetical protein LBI69_03435 [Puniceicoccales bacterium]|nr:hypothetical protein [Puniceicoccales bacterium]